MNSKYLNRFIKDIAIQAAIIISFSFIYYSIMNDFKPVIPDGIIGYKDCLLLSTTIQGTIGITTILPQTFRSTLITTVQQIISIMTALYIVFTLTMVS